MNKNRKEFKINFWNLSENVRFNFDKQYTLNLFDNCGLPLKCLSIKLDVPYPYVCHLRKSMYSIPLKMLLKISNLSGIPIEEIQKNIVSIRTREGTITKISLPIKENNILASLVGHIFGDGYIGKNKKQFEYSNTNSNLINEVKNQIYKLFEILPSTKKENRITYPAVIGEILESFGAPLAPKRYSTHLVPNWILASKMYKISFLKAFFDDDGSVMLSKNYRAKGVNLYVIRHIRQKEIAYKLLEQIRLVLKELEIYSSKPLLSRQYKKEDGTRVVMYLNITDYLSIIHFCNTIGLTQGIKFEKLKKIVNRKIFYCKGNERILSNNILKFLSGKEFAFTAEISKCIQKSKTKTLKKLKQLQNRIMVKIIGKVAVNRSYYWKFVGGARM